MGGGSDIGLRAGKSKGTRSLIAEAAIRDEPESLSNDPARASPVQSDPRGDDRTIGQIDNFGAKFPAPPVQIPTPPLVLCRGS